MNATAYRTSGGGAARRARAGLVLLLLALLAWPAPLGAQGRPRFEQGRCPFAVPRGMRISCGTLEVPEDRGRPDGPRIRLAVAIARGAGRRAAPDPVLYLAGGPGSAAVRNTPSLARGWAAFLGSRDLIVLDQRGTGFSRPSLACPEVEAATFANLGEQGQAGGELDALRQCRDRLAREGVSLRAYTSAASAADVEDLRVALGYERWNLLGISYGTRLALTVLRDHPHGVRSLVLDSVYPPDANLYTAMPANLARAVRTLFDGCAAHARCRAAFPDLEAGFFELVARLDAEPASLRVADPRGGRALTVRMDGARLVGLVFRMLYTADTIPLLPHALDAARRGDYGPLARLEARRLSRTLGTSHAMYFAVQCSADIAQIGPEAAEAALATDARLRGFFAGVLELTPAAQEVCELWGSDPPARRDAEAVWSDAPALLLAGEYDPITPPPWAEQAGGTLSRSYVFTFPGTGHAAITRGACPARIIRAFLDRPDETPDAACIRAMGGPAFVTGR